MCLFTGDVPLLSFLANVHLTERISWRKPSYSYYMGAWLFVEYAQKSYRLGEAAKFTNAAECIHGMELLDFALPRE